MSSRNRWIGTLAAGLAVLAGCRGDGGEPVARLVAEPMELTVAYGTYAGLSVSWTPAAEPEGASGDLRVFLHLLDEDGVLARTFDHGFPGTWSVGEERSYRVPVYQSLLAPPLPPGRYSLTAGLYDGENNRWPLDFEGQRVGRHEYRVAEVQVPARGAELPAVQFSPTWSPTLAGADRQVVAFRWLAGEGEIRLAEIPEDGTLWMVLRIPGAQEAGATRRLLPEREEGEGEDGGEDRAADEDGEAPATAGEPGVSLTASCSGFEAQVSGEGRHDLEVPVTGGSECVVTLTPNYAMESQAGDDRTVLLEVLAWRPAGG
ncbi:MAG TPA: hypothetical protein VLF66_06495 [Thermoanaerobaculia bacterium]|nr:hypothetical protein [Thermoanaerobaculia bacterium]